MNLTNDLLNFIKKSPSPFHVVTNGCDILKKAGFKELKLNEDWNLNEKEG